MAYGQMSSGRWDASGSWNAAVKDEQTKARSWAMRLSRNSMVDILIEMANDPGAYTTYQRRALLLLVADMIDD